MPPHAARTVFVANIPYDVSEEQLANVFSEAGPVSNVEIKFDPQTGRSKGYAFVQFYDEATALSAVRNLQEAPVNGRNLRVELSTDEPGPRGRQGGGGGGGGGGGRGGRGGGGGGGGGGRYGSHQMDDTPPPRGGGGGGYSLPAPGVDQGYGRDMPVPPPMAGGPAGERVDLNLLPQGVEVGMGQKATDVISKTLAAISPGQMQDVMASMKMLITTNPEQARQLLSSKPQLAYALFQAMLLMNIVDPSVLQRIQPLPAPAAAPVPSYPPAAQAPPAAYPPYPPAAAQAPPPSNYPPYPPSNSSYRPPPNSAPGGYNAPPQPSYGGGAGSGYGAPPPAPPVASGLASLPPSAQAALSTLPEDQQQMLLQVLQLSPDQINALDPNQKASIMQLRQQFLGAAA
ncbi:hypothetical protein CI109_100061 [Kwoniella shandongensis]|uniref:Uncharacterized protein n=1 Tax=Kwoniella shandongensis TaxID=1734106 RepID=A0A5M6BRX8_9TREE|nr:uncharacterized protein CI109_005966 [Kwoniella shandongensis]KAA5525658.1 hypothetical protein CI109_005966 [Kwoniella shandongensis]